MSFAEIFFEIFKLFFFFFPVTFGVFEKTYDMVRIRSAGNHAFFLAGYCFRQSFYQLVTCAVTVNPVNVLKLGKIGRN